MRSLLALQWVEVWIILCGLEWKCRLGEGEGGRAGGYQHGDACCSA
jgi:hypothetical protein